MRTLLRLTTISAAIGLVSLSFMTANAVAQQAAASPSANATRYGIAVVDVSYIFKNYSQFKGSMDGMKNDIQAAEAKLKTEGQSIEAMAEKAKQYQPSSAEFKQLDEEVARKKADLSIKMGRIRKDFQEREAKVYYETYMTVRNTVQYFAQQNNIGLVLRFNGDQINPNNPKAVLSGINQLVVSQNNIDITPDILALLNRGGAGGGVAPAASRAGQPRR